MDAHERGWAIARLLGVSAVVGAVVGLGFVAFEELLHEAQHLLWVELAGDDPSALVTIALASAGGLVLGLAIRFVPGHGGEHPADAHGLVHAGDASVGPLIGGLVVGFVGLVGGASLGPEGAVLPAAAGISSIVARWSKVEGTQAQLVQAAGLGALLAAMFGNPLAGILPLMEMGAAMAPSMTLLVLPALTAASTSVLMLQLLDTEPIGRLPFTYESFRSIDIVWALVIGVIAGAAGLAVDRWVRVLRPFTRRIDARSVLITTTAGGALLGVLYAIGGTEVRFAGIPELVSGGRYR